MNIFVAKLNPKTDADGLTRLFSSFGEVSSCKVIMDRDTGKSKCFAFVEMASDEAGAKALASLNESEFEGNTIVVKKSEPKPESAGNNYRSNDRNAPAKRFEGRGDDKRSDRGRDDRGRDDRGREDRGRFDRGRNERGRDNRGDNRDRNDRGFDTSKW